MAAGKREAVDLLVLYGPSFDPDSATARELLTSALGSGDMAIFQTILERFPPTLEWTPNTRRALEAALSHGMKEQVRLLLSKHPAPPTREGGTVIRTGRGSSGIGAALGTVPSSSTSVASSSGLDQTCRTPNVVELI